MDRIKTYSEISPSGTGAKLYCLVDKAILEPVRILLGTDENGDPKRGRKWTMPGDVPADGHPPALEIYTGGRYFAVTGHQIPSSSPYLEVLGLDDLKWLCDYGSKNSVAGEKKPNGGKPVDRSALALRIAFAVMKANPHATRDDIINAILHDENAASWYHERRDKERQINRIWDKCKNPDPYNHTDLGNAERFADQHQDDAFYVEAFKS